MRSMTMRTGALASIAAMIGAAALWAADSDSPKADPAATFKSPIIALTLMSDAEDLVLLKDVEQKALGERQFLVGIGVDDEKTPDWRNGQRTWVAVEDIQQIVEFPTVLEFHKSLELRKDGESKSASFRRAKNLNVADR